MYYTFGASCSLDLTARTRPFLSFNGKVAEGEERRGRAEWRGKASIEWPYRCQIRRHNRVRPSRNLADYLCIDGAAAAAEWTFTPDIGAHFIHCCPRKKKPLILLHSSSLDSLHLSMSIHKLTATSTVTKVDVRTRAAGPVRREHYRAIPSLCLFFPTKRESTLLVLISISNGFPSSLDRLLASNAPLLCKRHYSVYILDSLIGLLAVID